VSGGEKKFSALAKPRRLFFRSQTHRSAPPLRGDAACLASVGPCWSGRAPTSPGNPATGAPIDLIAASIDLRAQPGGSALGFRLANQSGAGLGSGRTHHNAQSVIGQAAMASLQWAPASPAPQSRHFASMALRKDARGSGRVSTMALRSPCKRGQNGGSLNG